MDINTELSTLLSNRLITLGRTRDLCVEAGDLAQINNIDAEILTIQDTLSKLS